ncbi:hypothetical protein IMZ29_22370, partial [Achromobacter sp. GG226]|nr:hypothetical protein [Verticiella sp. GG226]
PAQAAALIVERARAQGVTVSEDALRQHFAQQEVLDDDTLASVSGAGLHKQGFS